MRKNKGFAFFGKPLVSFQKGFDIMKSFIPWIGGKSRLRKYIIPLIPQNAERYIEVFGGAAWVMFGKEKIPGQMEVYNDVNGNLVNLYLQIKNNCAELRKELDWLQSREIFHRYRDDIAMETNLSDVQRAARFWYIIKCSFGANMNSFATAGKNLVDPADELPLYRDRLKNVIIENRDFEQIIKTYDRTTACFFLDPPYVETEMYYKTRLNCFKMADHNRLRTVLKGVKGRFILTYNDSPFIRKMYAEYNIRGVSRFNLLSPTGENRAEFKEVIITNF